MDSTPVPNTLYYITLNNKTTKWITHSKAQQAINYYADCFNVPRDYSLIVPTIVNNDVYDKHMKKHTKQMARWAECE